MHVTIDAALSLLMDGPYPEPAPEIGGPGWGPVPVCFGRTCLCSSAAAAPWLPYSTCCREARCPPGVADHKALQLLAQRRLLCLLVGLLCRRPGRDACRVFSREIELLFACFARAPERSASSRSCALSFLRNRRHTFCPKTCSVPGARNGHVAGKPSGGVCPPESAHPLHEASELGHTNSCCIKMTKIVQPINWLKS